MIRRAGQNECKQWVVFRLGHLGDVTLCSGVLAHLAAARGWEFTFVTRRLFADIYKNNPYVQHVVCVDEEDLAFRSFTDFSRGMARRYKGWGLLDLHGSLRSRLFSFFWRGPVWSYEKLSLERRLFLWSKGEKGREQLLKYNVPQRYYLALRGMRDMDDVPPREALVPRIWLSQEERDDARKKLDTLLGNNNAPVALHPYATHELKAWPRENWRELAMQLEKQGTPWIALGRGKPMFSDQDPCCGKDLTNATTLRELCALLSWCRVLVTGDSGPMHLAAAVQTPVIALFGPTTAEWGFYPEGANDKVLQRDLPCRPCSLHGRKPCRNNGVCLSDIPLADVLEALKSYEATARYRAKAPFE